MHVLIAGATGLVGRHCLDRCLADAAITRVTVLARRPAERGAHPKLDWRVGDLGTPGAVLAEVRPDAVVCALGTTIRQAGSQEAFRRVDHDYPLALATAGVAAGARHFLLVSSLGADARSRVFYNRVKGEIETAVRALPYPSLTIARPSLLLGDRAEVRPGEAIAKVVGRLLPGPWAPIHARDVAAALVAALKAAEPGQRVLTSSAMRKMARAAAA